MSVADWKALGDAGVAKKTIPDLKDFLAANKVKSKAKKKADYVDEVLAFLATQP